MNRRKAIYAILCVWAGKPVLKAQETPPTTFIPNLEYATAFSIDLKAINRFNFIMGDQTITLTGADIWSELVEMQRCGPNQQCPVKAQP